MLRIFLKCYFFDILMRPDSAIISPKLFVRFSGCASLNEEPYYLLTHALLTPIVQRGNWESLSQRVGCSSANMENEKETCLER